MFLADLGRMTADQEAVFRQLKRWFKTQRKALITEGASKKDLQAASLNRKSRHAALVELRKRFKAGESVDLLSPSFDEVAEQADAAAKAELDAEAKSPAINYTALALAAGAAYFLL